MERFNRYLYRGGRPNGFARLLNRLSALLYRQGWAPDLADTLEVTGRKSGQPITLPVVVVHLNSERYLVSMLGEGTNWVRNVRAAHGEAAMLKGRRTPVRLIEVPVGERAPIMKRYCEIATSGRHHIPVDPAAPISEFERIAPTIPVFRIDPR